MAIVNYDGTSSVTASSTDTVNITADPTTFTSVSSSASGVVLTFGSQTLTINGATLTNGGLSNVFVPGGTFAYLNSTNGNGTAGNSLGIALDSTGTFTAEGTTASSKVAVFGGTSRTDILDTSLDSIAIGGKGSFVVYSGLGNDSITQTTANFDSTSVVNVFAGGNNDTVTFAGQNTKASIFVGGGSGLDSITVTNSGSTTIFGGTDSTDSADTITFNAVGGGVQGAGGNVAIYGNGGADKIFVGSNFGDYAGATQHFLDSTSTAVVFGGFDDDSITVNGFGARTTSYGGEGSDTINVTAWGTGDQVYVAGGNASGASQDGDGADTIFVDNSIGSNGNILVYGNLGNDDITVNVGDASAVSIYGGKGADTIEAFGNSSTGASKVTIYGGEDGDSIFASNNGGSLTVYGGVQGTDSNDANDTIEIGAGSTGQTYVYGNFGDDGITVDALGKDSVNSTVVFGGQGKDSITIAAQTDSTNAGSALNANSAQKLSVYGNEGRDTFTVNQGTGTNVSIEDMNVANATSDSLVLNSKSAATGTALNLVSGTTFVSLQDALNAAATVAQNGNTVNGTVVQPASGAGAVVYQGNAYVVLESGDTAGFQANADQAIKLTGVTDIAGLQQNTVINHA